MTAPADRVEFIAPPPLDPAVLAYLDWLIERERRIWSECGIPAHLLVDPKNHR